MDWASVIPIGISALALVTSAVGTSIAVAAFRRTVAKERPLLTASIAAVEKQPGWYHCSVMLESRTNHGYRCEELQIKRPWRAKAIAEEAARILPDGFGNSDIVADLTLLPIARKVPMTLSVSNAGATRSGLMGQGSYQDDRGWERFLLFAPGCSSKSLSMRVTLSSTEAIERRIKITILRTLP